MSRLIKPKKNFTMVSNLCIRDNTISHGAKGLLVIMMSMPDNWNFSISGLANPEISLEGKDKIRNELKELEEHRYLVRIQTKKSGGKFSHNDYILNDEPMSDEYIQELLSGIDYLPQGNKNDTKQKSHVNASFAPSSGFPTTVKPSTAKPSTENPTQNNIINNKYNNLLYQSYQSNNLSNKEYMANSDILENFNKGTDAIDKNKPEETVENREHISTDSIKAQLNYDTLISEHSDKAKHIDSLVNLIADIMQTKLSHIRIAKECYPRSDVVQRFKKLTDKHILYVIDCLVDTKPKSKNLKNYLLTALYNAPATYESYIASQKQYSFDMEEFKSLINRFGE